MGQQTSESWTKWQKVDLKKKRKEKKKKKERRKKERIYLWIIFKKIYKKSNYYKFLFIYKNNIKFS